MNIRQGEGRKGLRKGVYAGSATLALSVAGILQSALAAENASSSNNIEEVTVTGTRASLESAIERKRTASTVVDSIVAEDVAQFPDKNVGEALQRITGVQLTRDFGEGVSVSIRGIEPDLNRIEINGVSLLGNGGLGARGADFRELASELIKSIDVYKGFTADMTEGGVGGTVQIQTIRPLELKKPILTVTAAAEYLDTVGKTSPRLNFTAGDSFFDNRFGAILNVTYDKVETRGDYLRDTEWVRLADFDSATNPSKTTVDPNYANFATFGSCSTLGAAGAANRVACETQFYDYSPRIPRYGVWLRTDKRTSGLLSLQFKVNDELDLYSDLQYNDRNGHYVDNNYVVDLTAASRFTTNSVVTDANHNVIDLVTSPTRTNLTTGSGTIFSAEKRDFDYRLKSKYYSGGFNWDHGNLHLKGLGVNSTATTVNDTNRIILRASIPSIHVQLDPSNGVPRFTFPAGLDPQSALTYNEGPVLQYRPEDVETSEDQGKLDLDWDLKAGPLTGLKFGTQYRTSRSVRFAGFAAPGYTRPDGVVVPTPNIDETVSLGTADNLSNPLAPVWTPARLAAFINASGMQTPGTFFDNSAVSHSGIPNSWLTPEFGPVSSYFDLSQFNHNRVFNSNGYAQIPMHDVNEKILAFYTRGDFKFDTAMPLTGNIGVRWVRTRDVATGSYQRNEVITTGGTAQNRGVQSLSIDNTYNDVLPSLNMALDFSSTLKGRFGASKVLARPKPTDLVPNATCTFDLTPAGQTDTNADTCTAGNPDLKPYRADQYDLGVEWYANKDTQLSAALFYKNIKTFILARTLVRGVDLFHDGVLFDVQQPINGNGAKISGLELSAQTAFTFLPSPFDGLGGLVNYTYSTAKDVGLFNSLSGEELGFPGLSKHSYNIITYYDKGPWNVRLAYNYRTSYLFAAAERSGNPVIRDGSAYLDGKATYTFKDIGVSLFIEAKNLLGETERSTSGGIRLGEQSYSGKRYFAGASYKF